MKKAFAVLFAVAVLAVSVNAGAAAPKNTVNPEGRIAAWAN